MTIEQNIISKISAFPQKKICIIGTMPEKFYILLAKNLMPNDCVCIFDTTGNISKAESSLNNAMYSNIEIMAFPVSNKNCIVRMAFISVLSSVKKNLAFLHRYLLLFFTRVSICFSMTWARCSLLRICLSMVAIL